jgi:hypothetical protein
MNQGPIWGMGLIHEKNRGQKSRATLPLRYVFYYPREIQEPYPTTMGYRELDTSIAIARGRWITSGDICKKAIPVT